MQITFNTDESLEDLQKIHEILTETIKKKGGSIKVQDSAQVVQQPNVAQPMQQPQQQNSFFQQPKSFAEVLKQDVGLSLNSGLGANLQRSQQQPQPMPQESVDDGKSDIQRINEEYKRQYYENRKNPQKEKGQNPEIDMSSFYYADRKKRF